MTQVEVAKKILEQNNCNEISCLADGIACPFYKEGMGDYSDCMIILNKEDGKNIDKVKQWLKEQEKEMIDLTVNQIVNPPVECWVKNYDSSPWKKELLLSIDYRNGNPFDAISSRYKDCTLTDPTKPKFKPWLKVEDVPVGMWSRNLYRHKDEPISSGDVMCPYKISDDDGNLLDDLVYLPLGKPLNSEWLEMGEWE